MDRPNSLRAVDDASRVGFGFLVDDSLLETSQGKTEVLRLIDSKDVRHIVVNRELQGMEARVTQRLTKKEQQGFPVGCVLFPRWDEKPRSSVSMKISKRTSTVSIYTHDMLTLWSARRHRLCLRSTSGLW